MTPEKQAAKIYQSQQPAYEKRARSIFARILNRQLSLVLNALDQGERNPNLDRLITQGSFAPAIFQVYEEIGLLAAGREYYWQRKMSGMEEKAKLIDLFTDIWKGIFRNYVSTYAYQIDNELTETTRKLVREELQKAYDEGLDGNRLITRIKRVLGAKNRIRATNIARTETTTAVNIARETGAKQYYQETGQQGYVGWNARIDERTRNAHKIENDTYIPIGQKFVLQDPKLGDIECDRPGDLVLPASQRCQCRCVAVYIGEARYRWLLERGRVKLS